MASKAAAAAAKNGTETAEDTLREAGAAPAAPERSFAPLLESACWPREAGVRLNIFEIVPPAATPLTWLLQPAFWSNVARRFTPGSTIVAYPRDGAWYAELIVWDAGQNWAHVSLKGASERPQFSAAPGVDEQFEIRRDPIDGYVVLRRSTGEKLRGNFTNAEEARRWIIEHQRTLARR